MAIVFPLIAYMVGASRGWILFWTIIGVLCDSK